MGNNQAICRYCGALIMFIRTKKGRKMPVDTVAVPYVKDGPDKLVTYEGEVISCRFTSSGEKEEGHGYVPHFATCTRDAKKRRRRA